MNLMLEYDAETDALFASFREIESGGVHSARPLDERRLVHYDHAGNPVGVEFLYASEGIDLQDVPGSEEIGDALGRLPRPVPVRR